MMINTDRNSHSVRGDHMQSNCSNHDLPRRLDISQRRHAHQGNMVLTNIFYVQVIMNQKLERRLQRRVRRTNTK